jgi:branched-chain amino acid transport system permease protein
MNKGQWLIVIILICLSAIIPFFASGYFVSFILMIFQYIILAYGWNVLSGYTGYISFGHVTFYGVGAYTATIFITNGLPWWLAILLGGVVATIISVGLGAIMLRLKGPYFAIGMLGMSRLFAAIATSWKSLTNGSTGIPLPPSLNLNIVYFIFLFLVAVCVIGTRYIELSNFGKRLIAIREDEIGAESVGINATFHKITAFAISACIFGLVGGAMTWYLSFVDPASAFSPVLNLSFVVMALLGGMGTALGPLIGAVALGIISEVLWAAYPSLYLVIYGVIMCLVTMYMPKGVVNYLGKIRLRRFSGREAVGKSL